MGLGPAAIRDVISMLKYRSADAWSIPAASINRALAFGVSQSGRFLRTYLYYGFNRDEGNRKVFDGVIAHVAGAGRGSFNHRFAQPSRDGHPYINFFYPTDIFPFTDAPERDPESGLTDGLLTHAGSPELLPKIFYTSSEYEYWGRAQRLPSPDDRRASGYCRSWTLVPDLPARRGRAQARRLPPIADDRSTTEQPARLPLGDEGAAPRHGSVDRERHGASAEPLSARG